MWSKRSVEAPPNFYNNPGFSDGGSQSSCHLNLYHAASRSHPASETFSIQEIKT
jgi:hypothetical protein